MALFARIVGNRNYSPSPAQYQIKSTFGHETPQWTIKGRYRSRRLEQGGEYRNLPSSVGNGPKITMKGRGRAQSVPDTPGPGRTWKERAENFYERKTRWSARCAT